MTATHSIARDNNLIDFISLCFMFYDLFTCHTRTIFPSWNFICLSKGLPFSR
jgi:hypothetical protein